MATKWEDFAPLAKWTDVNEKFLYKCWKQIKQAADERNAFIEQKHEDTFEDREDLPEFSIRLSRILPGYALTNLSRIQQAIFPVNTEGATGPGPLQTRVIDHDEIAANEGQILGAGGKPSDYGSLSSLLTGPLGYPSGTLLINTGKLAKQEQLRQIFEVLNYPVAYYIRGQDVGSSGSPFFDGPIQVEQFQGQNSGTGNKETGKYLKGEYKYDFFSSNFEHCEVFVAGDEGNNKYTGGDLAESPPWETPTSFKTYFLDKYNTLPTEWVNLGTNNQLFQIDNIRAYGFNRWWHDSGGGRTYINWIAQEHRYRFKLNPAYRATVGQFFDHLVKWNGYYIIQDDDLGTGHVQDQVIYADVTKEGDYYIIQVENVDFSTLPVSVAASPPTTSEDYEGIITRQHYKHLPFTSSDGVLLVPNRVDESGYNFYSP